MSQRNKSQIFAKKSFGQNFLVDENYIEKIISALNLQKSDNIIEIGPGRGALTEKLVASGVNVTAIELERDMISILKEKFREKQNFRLIEADALKVDFRELKESSGNHHKFKLVANLPYYISTAILQSLIAQRDVFSEMVLMFQREVVERIKAPVGSKDRGFLTVLTEAFLNAEKLFDVPPNAFRPVPKVQSSVIRLTPKSENVFTDEKFFREIISAGFVQKRKTIFNNLKKIFVCADEILNLSGIDKERRAETLTLSEWQRIYAAAKN